MKFVYAINAGSSVYWIGDFTLVTLATSAAEEVLKLCEPSLAKLIDRRVLEETIAKLNLGDNSEIIPNIYVGLQKVDGKDDAS